MEFMLSRTIKRGLRWYLKAKHFEKCYHLLIKERIVDITHSIENRGTTFIAGLASRVQNLKVGSILGATATIIHNVITPPLLNTIILSLKSISLHGCPFSSTFFTNLKNNLL
jgi:hypothetical protein